MFCFSLWARDWFVEWFITEFMVREVEATRWLDTAQYQVILAPAVHRSIALYEDSNPP